MLKGNNIIIFSSADWKIGPTSPQHIATNFEKTNKVLFIETFSSHWPFLESEHLKRIMYRILHWFQGIEKKEVENKHVYVYSPIIPMINNRFFLPLNRLIYTVILRRLIKKLDMGNPILYFYLPPPLGVLGKLKEKAVIYHSVDEWLTFPAGKNKFFMESERNLIEKADLVLAANDTLYESKKKLARRIYKIYHGVDYNHFTKKFTNDIPLPEDIRNIPKPIIAIIGNFAYWMDLELIKLIVRSHREWSVVSIGPVDSDANIKIFADMDNIYFLGQRSYYDLPNYYRAIDVFIIPFLLTDHIKTCAPTRLYEHLSSGKPIVTVDFPAVHEVGEGLLYIAHNREDFLKKIELALNEKDPSLAERRRTLAMKNTWESRIEKISNIIEEIISNDI